MIMQIVAWIASALVFLAFYENHYTFASGGNSQ